MRIGPLPTEPCATREPTAFEKVGRLAEHVTEAAMRAEALADRLLGGQPANKADNPKPAGDTNGLLPATSTVASHAYSNVSRINEALGRIEAALP